MVQILVHSLVGGLVKKGALELRYADGRVALYGDGTGAPVIVRFTDRGGPFALVRNPERALGELYMDGRLVFDEGGLSDLFALLSANDARRAPPPVMRALRTARNTAIDFWTRNARARSRANVAHHYDIDARLYDLFLDSDRQYSCAYYARPDMGLEEAQRAKKRHIAAKLALFPGARTLDIGCGWGGMALYLACAAQADVLGLTLSTEQLAIAEMRAQRAFSHAGARGRAQFRLQDYRDVEGPFDRIVSVGMFEHVGRAQYRTFFDTLGRLLQPDGVALLHTIGRPDGPGRPNAWINRYIFPGGYTPALSEIMRAVENSGLFVTDVEVLRLHYAETLKDWRARFMTNRAEAAAIAGERFCRMWEFYLVLAEYAFRADGECVFQIQIARRHDATPITRDYMAAAEERFAQAGF